MLSTEEIQEMNLIDKLKKIYRKGKEEQEVAEAIHDLIIKRISKGYGDYGGDRDNSTSFVVLDTGVFTGNRFHKEEIEKSRITAERLVACSLASIGVNVKRVSITLNGYNLDYLIEVGINQLFDKE